MDPTAYTTLDYMNELDRVRRAHKRNTIIVLVADAVIIAGVAALVLLGMPA